MEKPHKLSTGNTPSPQVGRHGVAPCMAYWIFDIAVFIALMTVIPSSILLVWLRLDAAASIAASTALGALASSAYLAWAWRRYYECQEQASSAR